MKQEQFQEDLHKKNGSQAVAYHDLRRIPYTALQAEKQRLGLAFGALAGLAYALVTWGIDGYLLARAHADLPWLKFLLGSLFCAGLGGLAGWLSERIDQALFTFLAWLFAGALFAWFASHLPFEIQSAATGIIDPDFRGLALYPYPPNANQRMVIIYIVVLLCSGLVGALQNNLVESARGAVSPVARGLVLAVCVPLMAMAGNSTDNLNEPLRNALLSVDRAIASALQEQVNPADPNAAGKRRRSAVDGVSHLLHRPRRLILGSYDPQDLASFSVYVDFGGIWATCSVLIESTSFCKPSDDLYPGYLACLLGQGEPGKECQARPTAAARAWLGSHLAELGTAPLAQVRAQRGDITLLDVQGAGKTPILCRFSGFQFSTVLQGCAIQSGQAPPVIFRPTATRRSAAPRQTPTPATPPSPAETKAVLATETLRADEQPAAGAGAGNAPDTALQAAAMLPEAQGDLAGLAHLTRYSIQAQIDAASRSLNGHSQVVYTNTEDAPLESLFFRLLPNGGASFGNGSLEVSRVSQAGQPLDTRLSLSDTALEVRLPAPLEPGRSTQLELDFQGTIPRNFGQTGYGIYNASEETLSLADWYPLLAVYDQDGWNLDPVSAIGDSVYADMAFYTVEITVPAGMVVAATGVEVGRSAAGSQLTLRFASGPAREFTLAMSDRFQVDTASADGITVNSYSLPDHRKAGKEALEVAVESVQAYNRLFGRYPYTELDVVEVPMNYAAGVEYPGIILVTESLYESMRQPFFTVVVAHEVGHQWWYNLVGNDVFDDPWLDEGLTTYTAALYWEVVQGPRGYQASMEAYQQEYDRLLEENQDEPVAESLGYFESLDKSGVYGAVVYEKAALFFHKMRQEIGDEAFFKALQAYFKEHRYGIATPDDLLAAFEQAAGYSVDDFAQKWLYTKK